MGISVNNNFQKAGSFVQFMKKIQDEQTRYNEDILVFNIKTLEERQQRYDAIRGQSFDVLPDSWRELASKKDKTEAEYQQMAQEYQEGFTNLGDEYVRYLDANFGNNDGELSESEYIAYELDNAPDEMRDESKELSHIAFSHLDMNKDNKIDKKEMASAFSMFDMSVGEMGDKAGGINGRIKIADYMPHSINLVKPAGTEGGDATDSKLKTMYEFLFGNQK